jgi:hypothetical protein
MVLFLFFLLQTTATVVHYAILKNLFYTTLIRLSGTLRDGLSVTVTYHDGSCQGVKRPRDVATAS